jgi:hypothetical protein
VLDLGDGGGAGEGELGDGLQLVRLLVLVGGRIALQNPWLGSLGLGLVIHYNLYIYVFLPPLEDQPPLGSNQRHV